MLIVQIGTTETCGTTVKNMQQDSGARMEKLNQGRSGLWDHSIIILSKIAVCAESQKVVSEMSGFGSFYFLSYLYKTFDKNFVCTLVSNKRLKID